MTVSFIPVPLITLLSGKGYTLYTETLAEDHIRTWFKKGSASEAAEIPAAPDQAGDQEHEFEAFLRSADPDSIRYVDVRELERPQPADHHGEPGNASRVTFGPARKRTARDAKNGRSVP